MEKSSLTYQTYLQILRRELVPAMGCTEPIAVAYCAAIARRILNKMPERVEVEASGNIIKNVKSVIVPNTDGRRGVEAAAAVGIVAGDDSRGLEVIAGVSEEDKRRLSEFLETVPIRVVPASSDLVLDVVVTLFSGSGNQGITVCVPVVEYAEALGCEKERLYRALLLSNLIAVHLKEGIGRLSAYCGAVSAGASAGAAISYLKGGNLDSISHTLVNALAISSGMVCDGAKPSCAAKIAVAVDTGLLAMEMYEAGQQFYGGDGIVLKGVENTIRNVGVLGREGMRETDKTIIDLMTR